jgi:hypothetical protein
MHVRSSGGVPQAGVSIESSNDDEEPYRAEAERGTRILNPDFGANLIIESLVTSLP